MSTVLTPPETETLADVVERLGDIPLDRILTHPPLGTATPDDLLRLLNGKPKRLCELVEGVLVEKPMGQEESRLAARLIYCLIKFLEEHDIGTIAGADGPVTFDVGLIRLPDVSFIPYESIPEGADPHTPMPDWIPALAVEILSKSNTPREIARKRREDFDAGVQLVWVVHPKQRSVEVYTAPAICIRLTDGDTLDGGAVLPGFTMSITDWFDWALKVKHNS